MLEFARTGVAPRLRATTGEIDAVLHVLTGGYAPADPPARRPEGWSTCRLIRNQPRLIGNRCRLVRTSVA